MRKWSGLKLFQDYCIPNSTATRNPLFLALQGTEITKRLLGGSQPYCIQTGSNGSLENKLKVRLMGCWIFAIFHSCALVQNIYGIALTDNTATKAELVPFAILNMYLIANQVDIRSRINAVMKRHVS